TASPDRRARPRAERGAPRRGGGLGGERVWAASHPLLVTRYCHHDNKPPRVVQGTIKTWEGRVKTRTGEPLARRLASALPRRRRTPERARQEILDAAERVFARSQPDQVGLKEVAREAGVSHALITHYFGTYAGLLEAALERRIRATREAA